MVVRSVHDRGELIELFSRDPVRHAYELGDLDDFFWPYTTWYRHGDSVALVYHGVAPPTLVAVDAPNRTGQLAALLEGLAPLLPGRFHAHLSPGAEGILGRHFVAGTPKPHLKMVLTDPARLDDPPAGAVSDGVGRADQPPTQILTRADVPELIDLYTRSYPGNWFDARMLETGQYVGVRRDGALVAVAGVHVWSPKYRIAALGNVTTRPDLRNQGLARLAVGALCRRIRAEVDHVTLNVQADNGAALALYTGLGFTPTTEFVEIAYTAFR